jgi:hypothetical protein
VDYFNDATERTFVVKRFGAIGLVTDIMSAAFGVQSFFACPYRGARNIAGATREQGLLRISSVRHGFKDKYGIRRDYKYHQALVSG